MNSRDVNRYNNNLSGDLSDLNNFFDSLSLSEKTSYAAFNICMRNVEIYDVLLAKMRDIEKKQVFIQAMAYLGDTLRYIDNFTLFLEENQNDFNSLIKSDALEHSVTLFSDPKDEDYYLNIATVLDRTKSPLYDEMYEIIQKSPYPHIRDSIRYIRPPNS